MCVCVCVCVCARLWCVCVCVSRSLTVSLLISRSLGLGSELKDLAMEEANKFLREPYYKDELSSPLLTPQCSYVQISQFVLNMTQSLDDVTPLVHM